MREIEWWWIRHAPVLGHEGRLYGQTDLDCDCSDEASLHALTARLPQDPDLVLTTPLRRTTQTLQALMSAGGNGPAPTSEADFSEQDFGSWSDLTWDEMAEKDPETYRTFWQDPHNNAPPEGESFAEVIGRVCRGIERWNTDRLATDNPSQDILCIAHAGSIRGALALALDLTPEAALRLKIDSLSLTRLTWVLGPDVNGGARGAWRVAEVNWKQESRR